MARNTAISWWFAAACCVALANGEELERSFPCDGSGDEESYLAMSFAGTSGEFRYHSSRWTDSEEYSSIKSDEEQVELKTAAFFWSAVEVVLEITREDVCNVVRFPISEGMSLRDIFSGGQLCTCAGTQAWSNLVSGVGSEPNCNVEGFNVRGTTWDANTHYPKMKFRIGIFTNEQDNCDSCDSGRGVGNPAFSAGAVCNDGEGGLCEGEYSDVWAKIYIIRGTTFDGDEECSCPELPHEVSWIVMLGFGALSMQAVAILLTLLSPLFKDTSGVLWFRLVFGWFWAGCFGWAVFIGACVVGAEIWIGPGLAVLFISGSFSPVGCLVWGLNPRKLDPSLRRVRLVCEGDGPGGRALTHGGMVGKFACKRVERAVVGPAASALNVYFDPPYIRMADDPNYAFDCRGDKYHDGNDVFIFWNFRGRNQDFVINDDRTVSPVQSPGMCLGLGDTALKLVPRADTARRLVFTDAYFRADDRGRPVDLARGSMRVQVRMLTGATLDLNVEPTDSVYTIKRKIYATEGVELAQQRLMLDSAELNDNATAQQAGVRAGVTLQLLVLPLGTAPAVPSSTTAVIPSVSVFVEAPSPIIIANAKVVPEALPPGAGGSTSKNENELSMIEMTERIKRELDIATDKPMMQAIEEACATLGVDTNGLNLVQKAQRCYAEVT